MDFLEKLNMLMKRDDYNKNSLSKASGIPYTTIDNWYKRGYDNLQLPTVKKLCSFFDTSLDFWLKEEITDPSYGKSNGFIINYYEMEYIKKYRFIAEYSPEGAKTISATIDREYTIAERMAELENEIKELKRRDSVYAKLDSNDHFALEHGAKSSRPQVRSSQNVIEEPVCEELPDLSPNTSSPPDIFPFNSEDRAAIKNGMKVLRSERNGKTGKNWSI